MSTCTLSCCPPSSSSPFIHQHSTSPLTSSQDLILTRSKRDRDYEYELSLASLRQQRTSIISCISCVLHQLFDFRNDELDPERLTMFHTEKKPSISVQAYFERIAKYGDCSTEALIFSLIHINRIMHTKPNFEITSLNIHRLLLTSIMCSAKFFDDHYFNNTYYSKIGGVPPHEMNSLEIEFLALINFDLAIDPSMYYQFSSELCNPELHQECDCYYWQVVNMDTNKIQELMRMMNEEKECYQVMGHDGKPLNLNQKQTTTVTPTSTTVVVAPVPIIAAPIAIPATTTVTSSLAASIIPVACTTQAIITSSSHASPLVTSVQPVTVCFDTTTLDSCHMSVSPNLHMSPHSCSSSSSSTSSHHSGSLSMSTSSSSTHSSRSISPSTDSMSPLQSSSSTSLNTSCHTSPYHDPLETCSLDDKPMRRQSHHTLVQAAR